MRTVILSAPIKAILTCVFALGMFLCHAEAKDLRDESRDRENKRQILEGRQKDYENQLAVLTSQRHDRELAFSKCASQKWRVFWDPRRKDAEAARQSLEEKRRDLMTLRNELNSLGRDLELTRFQIERKRRDKPSGFDYETEFRQYLGKVDGYFDRLDTELFYGYGEYLTGIQAYISFVGSSGQLCEKRDFSEPAAEIVASNIKLILDAVNNIAGILKRV